MSSFVWSFFKKIDKQNVSCNECGKNYKSSGNTTNLATHLKNKHHHAFLELKNKRSTKMEKCFLCGAVNFSDTVEFECIKTAKVPSSQKAIHVVLSHLGKLIKTTLHFERGSKVCLGCFEELSAYDSIMVNLMVAQKKLTQQLLTAIAAPVVSAPVKAEEEIEIPMPNDDEPDIISQSSERDEGSIKEEEFTLESEWEDSNGFKVEKLDTDEPSPSPRKRRKRNCEVCGKTFTAKFQLQNHINEVHSNSKAFTCQICAKTCKDEEYLELHMNTHEGKTENDCRYCEKSFSRPVNALRHMRMHWDKKKYQCERCGVRYSQDHLLYNHRLRHEAEDNPIICSICNISFKSRKTYNHHMLIHQENRPRHYCTMCPKSFTERYTLKMHMKTHSNVDEATFNNSQDITIEEQIVEEVQDDNETEGAVTVLLTENDNSGFCVICNVHFQSRKELDNHLQIDHDVVFK